ncbi:MAG TPA: LysM peptidoglycan-binding domain-containing protein [Anaerolineales bacterium]|nr:LysM peptidoglycan-binding domain-containing protein [Anaerolineales bacterium]
MRGLRGFGNALVVALLSIGLVVGAFSISLVEFVPEATPTATLLVFSPPVPVTATSTFPPTATLNVELNTATSTITMSPTSTIVPPTSCLPPAGWLPISVQPSDTLDSLAIRYRVTKDQLIVGNCLITETLIAGTLLYVPPAPTSTSAACVQGATGWIKNHVVKAGETLYSIATSHYTTVSALRLVNCRTGDLITPGEVLWVPNIPTRTPLPSPLPGVTVTIYPTNPLTETVLPFTATIMPSDTPIPPTNTPVPTQTVSPTPFPTP